MIVPIALFCPAFAGSSVLFGLEGELWDRAGRLPDFSYAGYAAGERDLPTPAIAVDVRDYGAVGDGTTDDAPAFQAAIASAEAMGGGVVLIPAGRWRIDSVLRISGSGVVLRGEGDGTDGSVLLFGRSLTEILGPSAAWSWDGGMLWFSPEIAPQTLTAVTRSAMRAENTLTIADPSALSVGDLAVLKLTDEGDTLGWHLHADLAPGGDCDYQIPLTLQWPVQLAAIDGETVTLGQPLRFDVRPEWQPEIVSLPAQHEVGVESLRLEFPDVPWAGHLFEPGYNGVYFANGVIDAWVRDVTVVNADNGFLATGITKWITFTDLRLEGRPGHHGFNLAFAADHLVSDVHIAADFVHALTVDHRANGNVFRRITADLPLEIDTHRDATFENLFTDIDAEISWFHGGSDCAGPASGARQTFWNLTGPLAPPYWGFLQSNLVGELLVPPSMTEDREWYEEVADLWPPDLYEAQRALRLGITPAFGPPPEQGTETTEETATETGITASIPAEKAGCRCDSARSRVSIVWIGLVAALRRVRTRRGRQTGGRSRRTAATRVSMTRNHSGGTSATRTMAA